MPTKTKGGWIAPKPTGCDYFVNGEHPTGVFVQRTGRGSPVSMEYAGAGTAAGDGFELPNDPAFLRDIATAINKVADEIEDGK